MYRVSYADGMIRLHVNETRYLDILPSAEGARLLAKMLRDAEAGNAHQRGYIGAFPTQATVDSFQKKIDWLHREPSTVRTIIEDAPLAPKKAAHSKPSRKIAKVEKKKMLAGIDVSGMEFEL